MDAERIGKLIKEIRQNNNLTQKDFADKYNVTYQAVSKWENGKNLPDVTLLRQISKDFNVNMEDLLDGNITKNKKLKKWVLYILIIGFMIVSSILIFHLTNKESFELKNISSKCEDFEVYGSLAYDNNKTSINISKMSYCGKDGQKEYEKLNCTLYEVQGDVKKEVSVCDAMENTNLSNFLNETKININNYEQVCKQYTDNSLYLEISAENDGNITTYKVPLKIENNCK